MRDTAAKGVERVTLGNGAAPEKGAIGLFEPVEESHSASLGLWFPVGSRFEKPEEAGFSHFVEHMLFKGSSSRDAHDIAITIDRLGGYLNAFTEKDLVCVHCTVPSRGLGTAIEVLCDMAFDSVFQPEETEKERAVILSELASSQEDPEERAWDHFLERIWPGQGAARKIGGEPEDVRRARRDDLYAYYQKHFVPADLLASLSGRFDPDEATEAFSAAVPRGMRPSAAVGPEPLRFVGARECLRAEAEQSYLYRAWPLEPPLGEPEYRALSALSAAFGDSSSSRLFQELREKTGWCYSVYSGFSTTPSGGLFYVHAAASPKDIPALSAELDRQAALMAERGLSEDEAVAVASHLEGLDIVAADDTESRMKRLARQYLYSGTVDGYEESLELTRSTGKAEVDAMAARALSGPGALFVYGKVSRALAKVLGAGYDVER